MADKPQPKPSDPLRDWLEANGLTLRHAISLRSQAGSVVQLIDAIKPEYLSGWQFNIEVSAVEKPESKE